MPARRHRSTIDQKADASPGRWTSHERGFSLVELAVVIVVLAVLVALAIPLFGGIASNAAANVLKSDLSAASTELEVDKIENRDGYPDLGSDGGDLSRSDGTTFEYNVYDTGTAYCLAATSDRAGVPAFSVSSDSRTVQEGPCEPVVGPVEGEGAEIIAASLEECFVFDATTGTIVGYGHAEADPAAPGTWSGYNADCTKDIVIPSKIDDTIVTAIGDDAFRCHSLPTELCEWSNWYWTSTGGVESVVIPDTVTSIGNRSFQHNALSSAVIPDGVTSIGAYAFGSNLLESMVMGDSVKSIGQYAFDDNLLTSIDIPVSVTSISDNAFSWNQLTSVTIGNSVTSIGGSAFQGNMLTSVTIPDSVTSIGNQAFTGNQLTSVTIPDSLTSIGRSVFSSNKLTSVTIPDSVTSIDMYAFSNNQLTSVTIPDSVTSIGNQAFQRNKLTSVTIPDSVTSIGSNSFTFNQLTSVSLPAHTSVGAGAFDASVTITRR